MVEVVVPRRVFEVGMIALALAAGLSALRGYKREAMILELSAFLSGFMSVFAPGISLIFKG